MRRFILQLFTRFLCFSSSLFSSPFPPFFSLRIPLFSFTFSVSYTSLCCLSAKFLKQKYTGGNRCFFFFIFYFAFEHCALRASSDISSCLDFSAFKLSVLGFFLFFFLHQHQVTSDLLHTERTRPKYVISTLLLKKPRRGSDKRWVRGHFVM